MPNEPSTLDSYFGLRGLLLNGIEKVFRNRLNVVAAGATLEDGVDVDGKPCKTLTIPTAAGGVKWGIVQVTAAAHLTIFSGDFALDLGVPGSLTGVSWIGDPPDGGVPLGNGWCVVSWIGGPPDVGVSLQAGYVDGGYGHFHVYTTNPGANVVDAEFSVLVLSKPGGSGP